MPNLVIFDCDGVLVDSEPIANRILAEELTKAGFPIGAVECETRFTGLRFRSVVEIVEAEMGRPLPAGFREIVHANTLDAFTTSLRPLPGVADLVRASALPRCVASSSEPDRIRHSLRVTGLLHLFAPHIFSATEVERGKPFPDLFLHAAGAMGARPEACIVVEDSVAGVAAARAARMRVVGFCGGGHAQGAAYRAALASAGAEAIIDRMELLAGLLDERSPDATRTFATGGRDG